MEMCVLQPNGMDVFSNESCEPPERSRALEGLVRFVNARAPSPRRETSGSVLGRGSERWARSCPDGSTVTRG